jgi:hypothetical protein
VGQFENNQVLYFFNQDSVIWKMTGFDAADFFQTEQTVNRKKSGFRAAPKYQVR